MLTIDKIKVSLSFDNENQTVGELILSNDKIYFKYFQDFLESNLNISPFKLPFNNSIHNSSIFEGLFGVFNDSLPDGWGKLLLDRHLQTKGINSLSINPLQRLSYIGKNGLGALIYEPEIDINKNLEFSLDLDFLSNEMNLILSGKNIENIDDLFNLGGSSGGARPKINVGFNPKTKDIIPDNGYLPKGFEHWIIKFNATFDKIDAAQIEFAYHKMALEAGLEMMPCELFKGKSGRYYFGTKRFDREFNLRKHLHSASGLLHDDFRLSALDYGHLMDAAFQLEKNVAVYDKILSMAAFNLFTHNRDDHSKNFSFLMDKQGKWQFAPVYDLTFSSSSYGNHSTSISGEYKNPTKHHLFELAKTFSIKNPNILLEKVKQAVNNWETIAKNCDVTTESRILIQKTIESLQ